MRQIVFLSSAAHDDIAGIWAYVGVENDNPQAAEKVIRSVHQTIDFIARFPGFGSPFSNRQVSNVRRANVGVYSIYYRHDASKELVEVLRILHSRQDKQRSFKDWAGQSALD